LLPFGERTPFPPRRWKSWTIPTGTFWSADFLRLEVLPKPIYQGNLEEVAFYEAVLNAAVENLGWREEVTEQAMELATRYGLSAIDAIHVSAALLGAADEFVTAEKPTKPFFRVREMPVISIRTL